jgi:Protein of unknown function (DUF3828)
MSSKFKVQSSKLFWLFLFAFGVTSCGLSVPNLEQSECTQARNRVKEFYSYHFGNNMKPSGENLRQREKFLTADLNRQLQQQNDTARDYFTQTDDYPKAFRVGACEVISPEKVVLEVLLFWKDDVRSQQHGIKVEAVKEDNNWLINKVENK